MHRLYRQAANPSRDRSPYCPYSLTVELIPSTRALQNRVRQMRCTVYPKVRIIKIVVQGFS